MALRANANANIHMKNNFLSLFLFHVIFMDSMHAMRNGNNFETQKRLSLIRMFISFLNMCQTPSQHIIHFGFSLEVRAQFILQCAPVCLHELEWRWRSLACNSTFIQMRIFCTMEFTEEQKKKVMRNYKFHHLINVSVGIIWNSEFCFEWKFSPFFGSQNYSNRFNFAFIVPNI